MERQDRLLPTPMPPEEKQALRDKAKRDILNAGKLSFLADLPGAPGDILSHYSKFVPVAGGQSIDDLYSGARKPSQVLSEGIGSKFFQDVSGLKAEGGFAENFFRGAFATTPIPVSAVVNTLQTGNRIAKMGSPFALLNKFDFDAPIDPATGMRFAQEVGPAVSKGAKVDDVPRTNAEVLMNESVQGSGGGRNLQKIDIGKKTRELDEVTPNNILSTDKSVYSRLIYDLENINKEGVLPYQEGAIIFPKEGMKGEDALNLLAPRPTFAEAEESGLVAYLNYNKDKVVKAEDMLKIARAYKPKIEKKVYSLNEFKQMQQDQEVGTISKQPFKDYDQGIRNWDMQLQRNIDLVATDYKTMHFNDPRESNVAKKQTQNTFIKAKTKGLTGEDSQFTNDTSFHDYGETYANSGYIGHARFADVTLDPDLNNGLTNGIVSIELQSNMAGRKDYNKSIETALDRVAPLESQIKKEKAKADALDAKMNRSFSDFEKNIEKQFGRKVTNEEIDAFEASQKKYRLGSAGQFDKDNYRLTELKSVKIPKLEDDLKKLKKLIKKGAEKSDDFGVRAAQRRYDIEAGTETEELIPRYIPESNKDHLNILTNEKRVLLDEVAKVDKQEGIGVTAFTTEKDNLIKQKNTLADKMETYAKEADQYEFLAENISKTSFKADSVLFQLDSKIKKADNSANFDPLDLSPNTIYKAPNKATDEYFDFMVDDKGGLDLNFKVRLAQNQVDGNINNLDEYSRKTEEMGYNFFQRATGKKNDNKELVRKAMISEAQNYYETQKLVTDLGESVRNYEPFTSRFNKTIIEDLTQRLKPTNSRETIVKAEQDLRNTIEDALDDSGINLEKLANEYVEKSIKQHKRIPAFTAQTTKDPIRNKKQAIEDLIKRLTSSSGIRHNKVKIQGTEKAVGSDGRQIIVPSDRGMVNKMNDDFFDASIYSIDNLNILNGRLGKGMYDDSIKYANEKYEDALAQAQGLAKKIDNDYSQKKYLEKTRVLANKLSGNKPLYDAFLAGVKHDAREMDYPGIMYNPYFRNVPFPNLKKATQFLARSKIEYAIENGKEFIAFPSRKDYAHAREDYKQGAFSAMYGQNLDEILREYAKKGAILNVQPIDASNKATISTQVGFDPMRVLDLRPLLKSRTTQVGGKNVIKKVAIPRMAKGGLFEKFRKAG